MHWLDRVCFAFACLPSPLLFFASGKKTQTKTHADLYEDANVNRGSGTIVKDGFDKPASIGCDKRGNFFVCDSGNHRVVMYNQERVPVVVFGQRDFSIAELLDPPLADSLNVPAASFYSDELEQLFVADKGNNRVLMYTGPFPEGTTGLAAKRVYGQESKMETNIVNAPDMAVGPFGLNGPEGVSVDDEKRLFVSDTSNHRILIFDAGSDVTDPVGIIGQGDFKQGDPNRGNPEATDDSFNTPLGISHDLSGNFVVADHGNNRILFFRKNDRRATRILSLSFGGKPLVKPTRVHFDVYGNM